jgi:hypothetical protein
MQTTINKNLLQYAVQTAIACPRCAKVLDMRQAVTTTLTVPDNGTRQFTMCCACWDKVRLELHDLAIGIKGNLDVLDGRDLFPPTLAEAKRIVKAMGMTLRYDREYQEYSVNYPGGKEATRCYTNDILDAIGTAKAMAKAKGGK